MSIKQIENLYAKNVASYFTLKIAGTHKNMLLHYFGNLPNRRKFVLIKRAKTHIKERE